MAERITLLLAHSPLVGPLTWESTAASLRRKGLHVVVPSLTAVAEEDPPYYGKFAEAAARALTTATRDGAVVLVGHSGAGALLPSVAGELEEEVRGAVFVDAMLPHPGSSWLDTAPAQLREQLAGLARAGRLPPWNEWFPPEMFDPLLPDADVRDRFVAELPALPWEYFAEPAPRARDLPAHRCAYVRLSEAYDQTAEEARRRGWWVHREEADHLAMLTRPDRIADLTERAATAVVAG